MRRQWILCGMLLLVTGVAHADFAKGSQTATFQLGGGGSDNKFEWSSASPNGRDEKAADAGGAIGAQYMYYVKGSPAIGLGFDINHTGLEDHFAAAVFPNLNSNSHFRPTTFMAIAKLAYPRNTFRPYIFGGLGLHSTHMLLELTPTGGATWPNTGTAETRKVIDGTGTGVAVGYGIGADWFLTEQFFFGVELRGTYLGRANYGATPDGQSAGFTDAKGDLSVSNILFRTGWKFGA